MEVALMEMGKLKGISLTLRHLWRCAVYAMTVCIEILKKAEREDGCCDTSNVPKFDPYLSSQSASALSVEEETCLALATLYDDPHNNNIDCPWDWRNTR